MPLIVQLAVVKVYLPPLLLMTSKSNLHEEAKVELQV